MSLITDAIFVKALRSNAELRRRLHAGDVYNTAIALPEPDALNAEVPYLIVSYDGMENAAWTKDRSYDGLNDQVTIGIEIAAQTREQLGVLAIMVRDTLSEYFERHSADPSDEDYPLIPNAYVMRADSVMYDSQKPCYWQELRFECDTDPDKL